MKIQLSDHFTYQKLFKFTLPSVIMMIFTSVYGVVDGYFVSNYVGKTPFAAVNFIYPFIMLLGAFGFMFGTGGSALIAKSLGQKQEEKANMQFSFIVYFSVITGVVIAVLGIMFLRPIASLLGAEGELLKILSFTVRSYLRLCRFLCFSLSFKVFSLRLKNRNLGCM